MDDVDKEKEAIAEKKADDGDRGHWRNPVEFFLSTVGYAIGMGSLWRFPYLAVRNGGGAFLIPYVIFATTFGFPLFFMESALGQYFQQSPIRVFDICPLFKGLGIVMCVMSILVPVYYMTVIAWALYFVYSSCFSVLPWSSCNNTWNSIYCLPLDGVSNNTINKTVHGTMRLSTEEFWENKVLGMSSGIEEIGSIQWHLALSLFVGWAAVFICIFKGIESSRIAVYITATLPFILLITFCAWSASFPGATDGMLVYITPRWEKMMNYQVWVEAFIQVFQSLGPAWGGIITLSSYNPFHHNCIRDAVLVTLADTVTAIFCGFVIFSGLGFMAFQTGVPVLDVVRTGPGLSFVTFPQVLSSMPVPQLWALLFFLLVFFLGIDSAFGMIKTMTSGLFDLFPDSLGQRKILVTTIVCASSYILGLFFVTQGGMYWFQIFDWYMTFFALIVVGLLECLVVCYLYGADRFFGNVQEMLGGLNKYFIVIIKYTLMIEVPLVLGIVLIFTVVTFRTPKYGDYEYPEWISVFGWMIGCSITLPIPIVIVLKIYQAKGTIWQRLWISVKPVITKKGERITPCSDMNGDYNPVLYPNSQYIPNIQADDKITLATC